jgi:flavin reductase (DIM6/NTAB) family NADH-FMN oxidoreductase RutF
MDTDAAGFDTRDVVPGQVAEADRKLYQWLSGRAAKGVAVVSSVHRGHDYAATVTDFLSVSYDPPTMVVSIYSLSRMAEAIEGSGQWALSLLADDQTRIADELSEPGTPLIALLASIPHFRREAAAPPVVAGSLAWFELRTVAAYPAATHTIFVGEVVWMGRQVGRSAGPLVRYESGYTRLRGAGE